MDEETVSTICDRCGAEIPQDEANDGVGDWEGAALCNDCYAEVDAEEE